MGTDLGGTRRGTARVDFVVFARNSEAVLDHVEFAVQKPDLGLPL